MTPVSVPVSSEVKPEKKPEHIPTKHIENATKGLKVTFPNGKVVWHKAAIETLVSCIKEIGYERVAKVGIMHGGYNLVSRDRRPVEPGRIWQHESDGWYIYSNISNSQKIDDLKRISDFYHLRLRMEEAKPV